MNPFFRDTLEPFPFDAFTVENIKEATTEIITQTRDTRDQIINSAPDDVDGRLIQRDVMYDELDMVLAPVYLMKETHPDDAIRAASQDAIQEMFSFLTELGLDEDLYKSLDEFSKTEPDLSPVLTRFLEKTMDDYLRNGFRLSQEDRAKLKELDDQITKSQLEFQKNIAEGELSLTLSEAELDGLPQDFLDSHRQEDGSYVVTTSKPDYTPFMKLAKTEDARKRLYYLYNSRAPQNVEILAEILELRIKRTRLLGFDTYAQYKTGSVMAETPEKVWNFYKELSAKLRPKAEADLAELLANEGVDHIPVWDKSFATNNLKEKKYQLDDQEVKCYFPYQQVCQGLFDLAQTLYSVQIKAASHLPVWHEDVQGYEIFDGERLIGRFYFDMYPRANKYSHAACFGLQSGRNRGDTYQYPYAALICNFPKPTKERPSLLSHDEVETFFHEFGHLMHQLLTTSELSGFAGTSVDRDFVEMPSQIMENWVWEKDALHQFARHYKTGEPIPDVLIDKMLAVKHLNSGIDNQQQLFYGTVDFTLHDGFEIEKPEDTTDVVRKLQKEHTLFEMAEGTCFQAAFGHLVGYAAGYYGYLWSRVYADDMYSVFKESGIFNPEVGKRFRDDVIAMGGTVAPMELIKNFLGREPEMDAFLEGLGVSA